MEVGIQCPYCFSMRFKEGLEGGSEEGKWEGVGGGKKGSVEIKREGVEDEMGCDGMG